MWTAKVPILVLLIRLFGVNRWLRIIAILTIVLTGLAILAGETYNAHICMPPKSDAGFTQDDLSRCTAIASKMGIALSSIGISTDIIIFLLPLPVIAKLQLVNEKKIGLAVVFLAGLGAIVASAVSLNYKVKSLSGAATDIQLAMILTILEYTVFIVAGCVPAIKAFWAGFIIQSSVYTKISSFVSQKFLNLGRTRKTTDHSRESIENINGYYSLEGGPFREPTSKMARLPLDSLNTVS